MDINKTFDDAVARAGGVTAFAKLLNVSTNALCNWRSRGVPIKHCRSFASLSSTPVWRLRPDDWHLIWPDLVGTDGAPHIAEAQP